MGDEEGGKKRRSEWVSIEERMKVQCYCYCYWENWNQWIQGPYMKTSPRLVQVLGDSGPKKIGYVAFGSNAKSREAKSQELGHPF